jgi:hypothetical protein
VLHQVGVSFDLYYDARKHKIKMAIFSTDVVRNFKLECSGALCCVCDLSSPSSWLAFMVLICGMFRVLFLRSCVNF